MKGVNVMKGKIAGERVTEECPILKAIDEERWRV